MFSDLSELTLAGRIVTVGINPSTDTTSLNLTRQPGLRQHSRKDEKIGSVSIRTAGDGWHVSSCLMLTSIISRLQTISEEGSNSAHGYFSFLLPLHGEAPGALKNFVQMKRRSLNCSSPAPMPSLSPFNHQQRLFVSYPMCQSAFEQPR